MIQDSSFRSVFQSAAIGMVLSDLDGRCLAANHSFCQMIGYSEHELLGVTFHSLTHPDDLRVNLEQGRRLLAGETSSFSLEKRYLHKDGRIVWALLTASLARDADGKPLYVISQLQDITERKRAGQEAERLTLALKRRARQLTALNNAVRAVASTLNPKDVLNAVIDEACKLLEAEVATVLLRDPGGDDLVCAAAAGPGSEAFLGTRRPITQGIAGWVMRERLPSVVNDVRRDPRFYPAIDAATGLTTHSMVAVPLKFKGAVWGVVEAINKTDGEFTLTDSEMLESLAGSAAVAMENARLFDQVRSGRQRLHTLSRRLVEVQEAERRHIARELHDEIGQVLTGLKLMLDMGARGPAESIRDTLAEAQAMTNDLLMRVREMSLNLRPAMLDDLGLAPTLVWYMERYRSMTNVQVDLRHAGLDRRFPPELETAAYRIIQEALTNVARHAGVREATVRVWATEDVLGVQVEDQGAGFDVEAALASGASSGLLGMRERVALLDGQLTLESNPGAGTCLTAELPLRYAHEAAER